MARIEEVQADIPGMTKEVRTVLDGLGLAESCENNRDLCENLRSAASQLGVLKHEPIAAVMKAEKCAR